MKRSTLLLAAAAAAALLLSGCNITIVPPGPPPADATLSLGTDAVAVWSEPLAPGTSVVFKFTVPTAQAGVVFFELDQDLPLTLRRPTDFSVFASSSSDRYFAQGSGGLAATAAGEFDEQGIGTLTACRGSCVILPGGAATYYARLTNDRGTTVTPAVYFFRDVEQDDNEENDVRAKATYFDLTDPLGDQGTIERLYDVDYFYVDRTGSFTFATAPGNPVDLRLQAYASNGAPLGSPVQTGTVAVVAGDFFKVYSASLRAGAPATSQYTLLRTP
ncbi:MAG: hypothetical protein H3C53_05020 [Trueperaceae bacterium]|nr:hypothetical protein [Trueperaceae bacterium]